MTTDTIDALADLVRREKDTVLVRWRQQVRQLPSAAHLNVPTLNVHVPHLLGEIAKAFEVRADESIAKALSYGSPPVHGLQRLQDEFDLEEIVAEYNILRGCVHDWPINMA
jgi:hypothetical protein